MGLKIAIPKETAANEKRVAASPETVKKLTAAGFTVIVQQGAGDNSNFLDGDYKTAGATLAKTKADAIKTADIVLCVQTLSDSDLSSLKKDCMVIGLFNPYQSQAVIESCASKNVTAMAMELIPRISRAQSMDVLSSQANLSGYKAVLDACEHYDRAFPMMMTAAGTIPPAKVFVMGAGVAGLQAIATAKRLGAVVSATDVRPAAKEQVQSLGGTFVAVEDDEFKEAESAGGYAKEMSAEYKKKQAALVEETIAKQDIVITTALIPGRPAPRLVTDTMVKSMKPGSVLVDLAVEQGGNVEGAKAGEIVKKHNATIVGHVNTPSRLATDASSLYARNLYNLVMLMADKDKKGDVKCDWDDDILKGVTLTRGGKIVHPNFVKADAKPAAAKKAAPKKTPTKTSAAKKATTAVKPAPKKAAGKTAEKTDADKS